MKHRKPKLSERACRRIRVTKQPIIIPAVRLRLSNRSAKPPRRSRHRCSRSPITTVDVTDARLLNKFRRSRLPRPPGDPWILPRKDFRLRRPNRIRWSWNRLQHRRTTILATTVLDVATVKAVLPNHHSRKRVPGVHRERMLNSRSSKPTADWEPIHPSLPLARTHRRRQGEPRSAPSPALLRHQRPVKPARQARLSRQQGGAG